MSNDRTPLKYLLNFCDIDRWSKLAPIGDWLADWFDNHFRTPTHDCPCCMAVRVLLLATVTGALGVGAGMLLS